VDNEGSIIRDEIVICPWCRDEDAKLGLGSGRDMGNVMCRKCNGKFNIDYDDEQELYIMSKIL